MNATLIAFIIYIIVVLLIVVVLNLIQSKNNKKYKNILDNLEIEKNIIDSTPINSEISKIRTFLKGDSLDKELIEWENKFKTIRSNDIPKITDMLLDADYSLKQQDYRTTVFKIAKLEMEVYKVKTNADMLLDEIKDITNSEEKNRAIITNFKTIYRNLYEQFQNNKSAYEPIDNSINLQFENIAKRFELFEENMDINNYGEVTKIIKSIDEMLKHMKIVIEEVPSIVLLATSVLPKKIDDIKLKYNKLTEAGYPLDYLNVDYNIEESQKKISDIMDRTNVLNLEDSLFELKVLTDYFDSLYEDFEKEKSDKLVYEELSKKFVKKITRINKIIFDIFNKMNDIIDEYNLSSYDINKLNNIKSKLEKLNNDYELLMSHTGNNTFAYSKLIKEIENLNIELTNIEEEMNNALELLGNMKEDESRARQQLDEIKLILRDSKIKLQQFKFPVIPNYYKVQLEEASEAIKEIVKELEKKPISIDTLNTRVDTARDLVFKIQGSTTELLKIARLAETAIVYGNRYRVISDLVDKELYRSELLFFEGNYKESLELSINLLNKIEPGIYNRLLNK